MWKKKNENDPNVLKLIKKGSLGTLRRKIGRFLLVVGSLVLQIMLFVTITDMLSENEPLFAIFMFLFIMIMFFYLFRCDMDASSKLTWLVLMFMFPVQVSIMLWITQKHIGHRKIEKSLNTLIHDSKDKIVQNEDVIKDPDIVSTGTDDLCRYLNNSGCFPIYNNTEVTYFPMGEDKFSAMLEELKKAEKFIFMEYFIIDEGYMWGSILKILADKAAAGVDVRVMYDGMCELSTLTADYPRRMEKLGIKCKVFSRIYPIASTHYNFRDHRKILVIDGKTAFNGGVNLADEYINKRVRFGHWKDTAVMLKGEAVDSFTLMFLQMWNLKEKEAHFDEFLHLSQPVKSNGYVMPYCDNPLDGYKVGENVYMDILNRAKSYVYIMTPYLILDNELESALKFAAQRGIDVRLILPGIPDKKGAYALAKSHYKYLIRSGIKLYEYTPGFVHAKVFVSDDIKAVVGTINLDYRSLYHHFECATYMYKTDCIKDIKEDYISTLEKCMEVTEETIKKDKHAYKVRGTLMKLIAPLM